MNYRQSVDLRELWVELDPILGEEHKKDVLVLLTMLGMKSLKSHGWPITSKEIELLAQKKGGKNSRRVSTKLHYWMAHD